MYLFKVCQDGRANTGCNAAALRVSTGPMS
jgi:hypothetical protein